MSKLKCECHGWAAFSTDFKNGKGRPSRTHWNWWMTGQAAKSNYFVGHHPSCNFYEHRMQIIAVAGWVERGCPA